MPDVFSSSDTFDSWFNTGNSNLTINYISFYCVYEMVYSVCYVGNIESNDNTIRKLHTVLRPFMLRRVSNNN